MSFLYPAYLWALVGLLVPVAIHLWSKKEGKTIKVGSTKLLSESDARQSRSIQLHEFLLLFLRIVLVSVLVFIITGPQIKKSVTTTSIMYLIEPSLLGEERMHSIIDTIEKGTSLRLLQEGFPEFEKYELDQKRLKTPNYWQLAKDMETLQADSIVVFIQGFLSGIKGMRPQVHKNIRWFAFDSETSTDMVLEVTKKQDSLQLLSVVSDPYQLSFKKELISEKDSKIQFNVTKDSIRFILKGKQQIQLITREIPTKVLLFYEDSLANEKVYIEASLSAISTYLDKQIQVESTQRIDAFDLSTFDLIVWLSPNSIPVTSTKLLAYKPDVFADKIIETGPVHTVFYLTASLNTENSIDRNVSEELLKLFDFHRDKEDEINRYDMRSIDTAALVPIKKEVTTDKKKFELLDISNWLWLLLGVLCIAERGVSKFRQQ